MNYASYFKGFMAFAGGVLGYLYGGWSMYLYALVAFVSLDYLSGVMAAGSQGKLDPRIGYIGIAKKVTIFIFVALGHIADVVTNQNIIMVAVIFYYLGTEFISITKNAAVLGISVPDILTKAIANFPGKPAGSPAAPSNTNSSQGGTGQ